MFIFGVTVVLYFVKILSGSRNFWQKDLFREILVDERTKLRKLLDKYDMLVQDEREHQDRFKFVLETFAILKDDDEIESFVDEKIMDLTDEIRYAQMDQRDVVEEIIQCVRQHY